MQGVLEQLVIHYILKWKHVVVNPDYLPACLKKIISDTLRTLRSNCNVFIKIRRAILIFYFAKHISKFSLKD